MSLQTNSNNQYDLSPSLEAIPAPYKKIHVLSPVAHEKLTIQENRGFEFTREFSHVPLVVDEFESAQSHYPIVFANGDHLKTFAVIGLGNAQNLFIDANGTWDNQAYIPAYFRRYPFIGIRIHDTGEFTMGFDPESHVFSEEGEQALFADRKPTNFTNELFGLCRQYAASEDTTEDFLSAVLEHQLLCDAMVEFKMPGSSEPFQLAFQVIDRKKFDKIENDLILEWRYRNWLGPIYAHFNSLHCWNNLVSRVK